MSRSSAVLVLCGAAVLAAFARDVPAQEPPRGDETTAALSVRALAPDDTPLADARVEAYVLPPPSRERWGRTPEDLALAAAADADDRGEVQLVATAAATWRVQVRAPGRATAFRVVRVEPGRRDALSVRLAEGHALEGVVVQEDDLPVPGATVLAGPVGFEADRARVLAAATTDAAGRYRLEGLPRGAIDLVAQRPGSGARWFGRFVVPNFARYDFRFPRGGRLVGVVSDGGAAERVAGARVRVAPFGAGFAAEAVSDEHGRYELWTFADEMEIREVTVTAPGRRLVPREDLPPQRLLRIRAGETVECDLTLRPAPRVVGRVTADGRPVAGADVALWTRPDTFGSFWSERRARTDGKGDYVFDTIGPATAVVRVRAAALRQPGFAAGWKPFSELEDDVPASARAAVQEEGDVRIDVELTPLALRVVEGRVVDGDGAPIEGASVTCGDGETATDAAGRFRLSVSDSGRSTWVDAYAPRFESAGASAELQESGAAPDVVIVLRRSPRVRVRVLDERGEPVAGATVRLGVRPAFADGVDMWPPPRDVVVGVTGPDGVAVVSRESREGDSAVHASAPGYAPGSAPVGYSAKTGDGTAEVFLEGARDALVRVVDAGSRAPIANAWLTLGPDEDAGAPTISAVPAAAQRGDVHVGRTGADGTFRLGDLGRDAVRVHASAAGHHAAEARVAREAKDVVVAMEPHLRLSGHVVWEDGRAAAGVVMNLVWRDAPPDWPSVMGPWEVGETGAFDVGGLRRGRYVVDVMSPDRAGGPAVAPMVAGPFAAGTSGVVVTVRPARPVRGVVVAPDGAGVADAAIEVRPDHEWYAFVLGETRTAADGTFLAAHCPHGPVRIRVVADREQDRRVTNVGPVDPGDEVVRIVIEDRLAIEGRVLDAEGKPRAGTCLAAIPSAVEEPAFWRDAWNSARTDAEGRFRIAGLESGTYRVWLVRDWTDRWGFVTHRHVRPEPLGETAGVPAGAKEVELTLR